MILTDAVILHLLFYTGVFLLFILYFSLLTLTTIGEIMLYSFLEEDWKKKTENRQLVKMILPLIEKPKVSQASLAIFKNLIKISLICLTFFYVIRWAYFDDHNTIFVLILTLSTVLLLFFEELLPKAFLNQSPIGFVKFSAIYLTSLIHRIFRPVSALMVALSNLLEQKKEESLYEVELEELPDVLDEIPTDNDTSEKDKELLKRVANLGYTTVKEIMTARIDITAFEIDTGFPDLLNEIRKYGYSRVPVYRDTIDTMEGILYIKDLIPNLNEKEKKNYKWSEKIRPPFFVPLNKKIDKLLKDFQEKRTHMAIVVDEYGGTAGLVTMEDIIEEIVGEIDDENDEVRQFLYTKIDDYTFLFEGKILLPDFCKVMEVDPEIFEEVKGDSQSLGGLMLEIFERFPKLNEEVKFDKYIFTIVSTGSKRIKIIKVRVLE